ncbi:claspin-like [Argopecten irradians]|uniref:claspin-like n=1 Tax=Argopecten irradians TaxID=31199 RepID=UPI003716AD43
MEVDMADTKGGEAVEVNVLDDILDGHVDDELTAEIGEQDKTPAKKPVKTKPKPASAKGKAVKPKAKVARPVKKETAQKVSNVKKEDHNAATTSEQQNTDNSVVVSESKEPKPAGKASSQKTVSTKSKEGGAESNKESKEKPVKVVKKAVKRPAKTKTVVKVEKVKIPEEPMPDPVPMEESMENLADESDDKLDLLMEESETRPVEQQVEHVDTQDYDTRSEAGSSAGDVTSFSDSGSDAEMRSDDEEGPSTRKKKKRGISPIEWDRKSGYKGEGTEQGEEEKDSEEEEEENKSGDENDNKSDKSDDSSQRRMYSKLKYLFRGARYFLIKSNNHENVALAKAKGVWSTPPQNESKLNQAFRSCDNVILIFSVKESGKFQGFARIVEESTKDHPPIRWVLPPGLSARALSGVFKLDWINRRELSFTKTSHLHNSWNDNKPVKIGRDGQEIEARCGETVCKMFPSDNNVDLSAIVRKAKKSRHGSRSRVIDHRRREPFRGGSSGGRRGDFNRRRRYRDEMFDSPRRKRFRSDMDRDNGMYKDRRMESRSPRYAGVTAGTHLLMGYVLVSSMEVDMADTKGGEAVEVNVLDDILDGHVDDELTAEIGEQDKTPAKKPVKTKPKPASAKGKAVKPKAKVARPVKKETAQKVSNVKKEDHNAATTSEQQNTDNSVVVSESKEPKPAGKASSQKTVSTKSKEGGAESNKESKEKPVKVVKKAVKRPAKTKTVVKVEKVKIPEEPMPDPVPMEESMENLADESDDKLDLLMEESETRPVEQQVEHVDTQDYDTRSEAGSSAGDVTSFSDSGSDAEMRSDDEEGPSTRKKKKRGISPIEWDRKSGYKGEGTEQGEEEKDSEEEEEENKSGDENDNKSDKSDDSSQRRMYSKLKYLFRGARYFLIKSNNHENVALAKAKGVWSTPPQNESKLNQAFRSCDNVILIFSVKESGKFQGFARIVEESTKDHPPIRWVLPPGLSARALSGVFKLDWINRRELSFTKTSHLHNSWNDNKPVKIGRDGQEIEARCGETVCKMFPSDNNVDLSAIVRKAKKSRHGSRSRVIDHRRREPFRGGSSGGRRGDFNRRRRYRDEMFDSPRRKRFRSDMDRDNGMYKDRRMESRSPRYAGVRRDTFINGSKSRHAASPGHYSTQSYNDYIREFAHARAPPPPMHHPYGPPPPGFGHMEPMPPYPGHYERPREFMPTGPDYSSQDAASRSRATDKRSYERDVDDFLRRTSHPSRSSRDRSRDRDRDRDRHRHRDRR